MILTQEIAKFFADAKTIKQLWLKYLWSKNCNNCFVKNVNSGVWRTCNSAARKTDLKLQHMQKSLAASWISPTLSANFLLKLSSLFREKYLSSLISVRDKDVKIKRRDIIQPDLRADYKLLCSWKTSITQFLFGYTFKPK